MEANRRSKSISAWTIRQRAANRDATSRIRTSATMLIAKKARKHARASMPPSRASCMYPECMTPVLYWAVCTYRNCSRNASGPMPKSGLAERSVHPSRKRTRRSTNVDRAWSARHPCSTTKATRQAPAHTRMHATANTTGNRRCMQAFSIGRQRANEPRTATTAQTGAQTAPATKQMP